MSAEGSPTEIKDKSVDELIRAIEECPGQYAFLIGAGTSKPAGIPTSGELIKQWKDDAFGLANTEEDKQEWITNQEDRISEHQNEYGFWFEQVYTTKEQRREFIENELIGDATPEFGHIVLASMMADNHGDKYVPFTLTPNFDNRSLQASY